MVEIIKVHCGALHPETARDVLLHKHADFAVSFDGDADRAMFVDETGEMLDGDHVLAMCAKDMQEKGTLKKRTVVATVMSNLGLDLALKPQSVQVLRTEVGDRYVVERMLKDGYNLGGEQSGHPRRDDSVAAGFAQRPGKRKKAF